MNLNSKGNNMRFPIKGINLNSQSSSKNNKIKKASKFDIKRYKVLNSFLNRRIRFKNISENNDYSTINTASQKSKNILYSKNDMPYIPSKEKKKGEINFIQLIKLLMNNKNNSINRSNTNQNIFIDSKISNDDPYKPKGYNFYKYSREHPELIKDSKRYLKIIQELNKKIDNIEKGKERSLSYNYLDNDNKSLNKLENDEINDNKMSLNKIKKLNNLKLNNNIATNNLKILPISKSYSGYSYTIDDNNILSSINTSNNNEILKTERENNKPGNNLFIHKDINNNKDINLLPLIYSSKLKNSLQEYKNNNINKFKLFNKKDYNSSDIFNLKEDNFQFKTPKDYLVKNNYMPLNNISDTKTSISEVGWSPNNSKIHSRICIPSVEFNILCPSLKNISPTKKDIDLLNKNNTYKSKIMSEFIDMCKPGDSELRKDYKDKLNSNKNYFHRINYCSSYYDMHHEYKDLIYDAF